MTQQRDEERESWEVEHGWSSAAESLLAWAEHSGVAPCSPFQGQAKEALGNSVTGFGRANFVASD